MVVNLSNLTLYGKDYKTTKKCNFYFEIFVLDQNDLFRYFGDTLYILLDKNFLTIFGREQHQLGRRANDGGGLRPVGAIGNATMEHGQQMLAAATDCGRHPIDRLAGLQCQRPLQALRTLQAVDNNCVPFLQQYIRRTGRTRVDDRHRVDTFLGQLLNLWMVADG